MVNNELRLSETVHPNRSAKEDYDSLICIDKNKEKLLTALATLLDKQKVQQWLNKHHPKGLGIEKNLLSASPLVILSGEVGCGKTALANSVATPLAEQLGCKIYQYETPSNIRGSGAVGEISNRITEAFESVKSKLGAEKKGILVIDEADDLATSRAQNQAHHEDRAGLNVLIKQIDLIAREHINLAVILITNRVSVFDPAVRRRTNLHLQFERPGQDELKTIFSFVLNGVKLKDEDVNELIAIASTREVPYSFSDLIQRAGKQSLYQAIKEDIPFDFEIYKSSLLAIEPSPLIEETSL